MKMRSLKTKVIFSVLLIFFLIFPAFTWMGIYYFKYNAKKSVRAQQFELVSKLADEIDTKLLILTRVLRTSAQMMSEDSFKDHASADLYIRKHISLNSVFDDNILIFNEHGQLLAESGDNSPERRMMSFLWRDYISVPMKTGKLYISAPLMAAASTKLKSPMVVISAPVIIKGKLKGFLCGSVNLYRKNIFDNSVFTHLNNEGWIYVVDSGANVVMHPDRSKIVGKVDMVENPRIKDMIKAGSGSMEYEDGKNRTIQASFSRIPIAGWTVIANYKSDSIFRHIYRAESTLIFFVISGAFIVFFMLSFVLRSLINPLISLKEQVRSLLSDPDSGKVIKVDSNDEVMDTADAFNELLEEINRGKQELKSSNELLQIVCDFSTDWVYWVNDKGKLIYISPAAEEITGYTKEELSDYPLFYEKLIHPEDYEKWLRTEQSARLHREACKTDIRIISRDGAVKWLSNHCKGIFDNDRFIGLRGAYTDITSARTAEEKLISGERKYRMLIQNSGSPVVFTDENFLITEHNEKAYSLLTCSVGSAMFPYLNVSQERVEAHLQSNSGKRTVEIESDLIVYGSVYHYLWHINMLTYKEHGVSGYMVIGTDITGKMKRNEELSRMAVKTEISKYVKHMEAIIKSVSEGIISFDKNGCLSCYNSEAEKLFLLKPEDMGKSMENINEFFATTLISSVKKTAKNKSVMAEYEFEGGVRFLKLNITPLLDSDGKNFGTLVVVSDETAALPDAGEDSPFEKMIGRSDSMRSVFSMMRSLADVDSTVLVLGESGTGKELVAAGIHESGKRRNKPFIKLNCSAIPENLLESELFGHVKGAFTGAYKDKTGKFEAADGGTIFLDEIGDISPNVQVRLLRVLQEKEVEIIGRNEPVKVDVRVIAATNRDLKDMVSKGNFREDLYYRLKVVTLVVPPLRERKDDILALAMEFINRFNIKLGKNIVDIADDVKKILIEYDWPGNVRELEHVIEYACLMTGTSFITRNALPADLTSDKPQNPDEEKEMILKALDEAKGYKAKAARILKMGRATLYRKMQEYDIEY
ncbi:sigma 54-interacting transcriptional regulator [Seleniivibrio woodruffii]|uniref:PAS domain S-box-containing protein n=1 Tax=Seleniivibrio woodruffii TaxID=1078050 RepID=A0A4R1K6P1_9BACT|nr:sigma 54-interacting transcriptional regulator [Seleniivibrio woodruffii]TCK59918.1 PAS domain S-box-containing protein [Seleniivibrio woodruffii]TVZ35861.1 PAS domain S-box-containing protein [Seleniivibrio woodruffii]